MSLSLVWKHDLKFDSGPGGPPIVLDSSDPHVLSPMQTLAYAVMACMAMDIAYVLEKGRHDLRHLEVTFDSTRAPKPPKRYTSIHLHFTLTGRIPAPAVERAIALSRSTYCSVSNSLREDIPLEVTFEIKP